MQPDPKHSLALAFEHLEAFSLPGIGTFRREMFSAVIDHQSHKIIPPGERFVFEKGESLVEQLEQFLFRYWDLSIDKAKELTQAVGAWVKEELSGRGLVFVDGLGELRSLPDDGVDIVEGEGQMLVGGDFFGLSPVNFEIGTVQASQERKAEVAKKSALANQQVVEPAPPPVRKRRGRGVLLALLLLLLIGSGAGMIWNQEFKAFLQKQGWIDAESTTIAASNGAEKPGQNGAPAVALDSASQAELDKPETPDSENPAPNNSENASENASENSVAETDKPAATPKEPTQPVADKEATPDKASERPAETSTTADKLADSGENVGSFAENGRYYLIVGVATTGAEAESMLADFQKAGIRPRIIAPRGKGYYKISVFDNTSKDKVIARMVEWKNKFPEKSWIYWTGM